MRNYERLDLDRIISPEEFLREKLKRTRISFLVQFMSGDRGVIDTPASLALRKLIWKIKQKEGIKNPKSKKGYLKAIDQCFIDYYKLKHGWDHKAFFKKSPLGFLKRPNSLNAHQISEAIYSEMCIQMLPEFYLKEKDKKIEIKFPNRNKRVRFNAWDDDTYLNFLHRKDIEGLIKFCNEKSYTGWQKLYEVMKSI